MKYCFDTEFIEDGHTIELISIGMIAEDGRELYLQNANCDFSKADEWVARNVFPNLEHYLVSRNNRSCKENAWDYKYKIYHGACLTDAKQYWKSACPWRDHRTIKENVLEFTDETKYGKPEFWAYYADYDWVVFCQLFGRMVDLPDNYPKFCMDIKQLLVVHGNPQLVIPRPEAIHNALEDARWNAQVYNYLRAREGRLEDTFNVNILTPMN